MSEEPSCQLCISNLPPNENVDRLHKLLKKELHVEVLRCKIKGSTVLLKGKKTWKHSGYAYVHLATEESARFVLEQAESGQWKPWGAKVDAEFCQPKGKSPTVLKDGTLDIGTMAVERQGDFHVTFNLPTVQMEVNLDTKKMAMLVMEPRQHNEGPQMPKYKLEWLFRNIKAVGGPLEVGKGVGLLLETTAPPHIYARSGEDHIWESSFQKDMWVADDEDPWARTVDFTRGSLGLCRVFLVTFPYRWQKELGDLCQAVFKKYRWIDVLRINDHFLHWNTKKMIDFRVPFPFFSYESQRDLPLALNFLITSLVLKGVIAYPHTKTFDALVQNHDVALAEAALRRMLRYFKMCTNPAKRFNMELGRAKRIASVGGSSAVSHAMVRRVIITPTTAYGYPEEMELSNRVVRHFREFSDYFIRVTFTDELQWKINSFALNHPFRAGRRDVGRMDKKTEIYDRILRIVTEGFVLCGLHFQFLASSNSQFRLNSAWFYAEPRGGPTLEFVQGWMGDFSQIRNVAKCLSRMGQCFSSSFHRKHVARADIEEIPDVEVESEAFGRQVLTDGVGRMRPEFALQLAGEMSEFFQGKAGACLMPTAYQIRYAGYKGVLGVWPASLDPSSGAQLSFRPSQNKFCSAHCDLEVVNWARFMPAHLNRQIIILLTALGVGSPIFYTLQKSMIESLDRALEDGVHALWLLESSCLADEHHTATTMLKAGWEPKKEPHLRGMLLAMRALQLQSLKSKAKIFVPKGRWLLGTVDETKSLQPGQCFLRVSGPPDDAKPGTPNLLTTPPRVITGKIFFGKNPCLHPGDLRFLEAVDVPGLHFKVDELILPATGLRSHANEASGSDFDGDVYFVSWDERLMPENAVNAEPMVYAAPAPVQGEEKSVETKDIRYHFVKNMTNDMVGIICNAHLVHADLSPLGALDEKCKELAKQAAISFDFPKTGIAGRMPPDLRVTKYPDFMEKEEGKETYRSSGILGTLYRVVKRKVSEKVESEGPLVEAPQDSDTCRFWWPSEQQARDAFDSDLVVGGYEKYVGEAWELKKKWDLENLNIMHHFGIPTEAELVTGFIVHLSRHFRNKQGTVVERVRLAFNRKRAEFKEMLFKQEKREEPPPETDAPAVQPAEEGAVPPAAGPAGGGAVGGSGSGDGDREPKVVDAENMWGGEGEGEGDFEGVVSESTDFLSESEGMGEGYSFGSKVGCTESSEDGVQVHPGEDLPSGDGGGGRAGEKGGDGVGDSRDSKVGGEGESTPVLRDGGEVGGGGGGTEGMGSEGSEAVGEGKEGHSLVVESEHEVVGVEDDTIPPKKSEGESGGSQAVAESDIDGGGEGVDVVGEGGVGPESGNGEAYEPSEEVVQQDVSPGSHRVEGGGDIGGGGQSNDENEDVVRGGEGNAQADAGDSVGEGEEMEGGEGDEVVVIRGRRSRGGGEAFPQEVSERASAWYYVTYHPFWLAKRPLDLEGGEEAESKARRPVMLSFAWVGDTVLASIKKGKVKEREASLTSLAS